MADKMSFAEIEEVLNSFRKLYKTSYDIFNQKAKNYIITPGQFHLLNTILHHDGINQRELADMLKITPATLSVRIRRLEKENMLVREADMKDKRNYILTLTPQGKQLIEHSYEHMRKNMVLLFRGVTSEEMTALKSCLSKIQHNLDKKKEENHAKD